MDVFVARPQQTSAPEFQELFTLVAAVQDGRYADLARQFVELGIGAGRQGKGQELVRRVEIGLLQPHDVARVLRGGSLTPMISEYRPDTGLLQSTDAGVAMLRRVVDLRNVDHRGRARI